MMKKLLCIMATLAAMGGCKKDHADRTAAGWHVNWLDQGTIATGLHTLGELHALFDAAMQRACAHVDTYYAFPAGTCEAKFRGIDTTFELRDNFYFPVVGQAIDAPSAMFAYGETVNRYLVIVAFYSPTTANSPDPASVPATALSWTVVLGPQTGNWYWGTEVSGNQFPALDYELHWFFSSSPTFS